MNHWQQSGVVRGLNRLNIPHPAIARCAFAVIFPALILAPMILFPLSRDQGLFTYAGQVILDGGFPYRDVIDQKTPATHYSFALALLLHPDPEISVRLFFFVMAVAGSQFAGIIGEKIVGPVARLPCAVCYAVAFLRPGNMAAWNTGQPEDAVLVLSLAALCTVSSSQFIIQPWRAVSCGALLGLACLYKQTAIVASLAMFGVILGEFVQLRCSWKVVLRQTCFALMGFALPTALFVAYFAYHGLLREFWIVTVQYNMAYANVGMAWHTAANSMWRAMKRNPLRRLILAAAIAWLPQRWLRSEKENQSQFALRLLTAITVAHCFAVVWQRKMWGYHWTPFVGCLAVLGGCGIGRVFAIAFEREIDEPVPSLPLRLTMPATEFFIKLRCVWQQVSQWGVTRVALALISVVAAVWVGSASPKSHAAMWQSFAKSAASMHPVEAYRGAFQVGSVTRAEQMELARYLNEETSQDSRIMIWGYECVVYVLAERKCQSRFTLDRYLCLRNFYLTEAWRAEFVKTFREKPPVYFVVVEGNSTNLCRESRLEFQEFPELREYVDRNYTRVRQLGRFEVYRHRRPRKTVEQRLD